MQTDALFQGMNALDYQVANFSLRELAFGYDAFLARREKAKFEFISANIAWQDNGELLMPPTTVRTVALRQGAKAKSVRIGFVGLTRNNPAFLKEGPKGRRIVTLDPFAAAEKVVPALKQKADVIIALVSLGVGDMRLLPKRVKDIDLVLGGNGSEQTRNDDFPEDTQIGQTRLLAVGDQGKMLGEVRLFFNDKRRIASTQRNLVGLSREWPGDPELEKLMESTKIAVNEFNRAQTEGQSPFASTGPGAPPSPAASPTAVAQAQAATAAYTGSERCATCHAEQAASWQRTGHARAFAALEKAHQDFNPQCVGCHTVGYGKPQGFVSARETPRLVNVGCEACHGPSGGHPGEQAARYGRTDTSFCASCHTKENSPDFDPATYIPKVRHWSDAKASR
jgi:2',3'-cyclic-nucleotide 2'-phosphodiesterase (5'-nucleotidase family)